jgi:uncharacterized protein (DUF58 family)
MSYKDRLAVREALRMKKPLKTAIHPTRIIAYLVQLTIASFAYYFLRNHFLMLVLFIIGVAPFLDIISLVILHRSLQVELVSPEKDIDRFSVGFLRLSLINKSLTLSYDVNVKLDSASPFYDESGGTILSLPCSARGTYEQQIPIKYSMNGIYRFSISTITIRDLLGFISLKKDVDVSTEVNVFPEKSLAVNVDMSDMNRGMTESEETVKKGHDFSDVSDVREYIPGDKLMSIHWKLSAKRDILMVKDRVAMSDEQMVILAELAGEPEEVDEVLTLTYAVIKRLVEEQTYVRLLWWSEGNFEFVERQIMSIEDLKEAFSGIYYETIYADPEKTKGYMLSIRPELKAYINIRMKNGQPDVIIVEQD